MRTLSLEYICVTRSGSKFSNCSIEGNPREKNNIKISPAMKPNPVIFNDNRKISFHLSKS